MTQTERIQSHGNVQRFYFFRHGILLRKRSLLVFLDDFVDSTPDIPGACAAELCQTLNKQPSLWAIVFIGVSHGLPTLSAATTMVDEILRLTGDTIKHCGNPRITAAVYDLGWDKRAERWLVDGEWVSFPVAYFIDSIKKTQRHIKAEFRGTKLESLCIKKSANLALGLLGFLIAIGSVGIAYGVFVAGTASVFSALLLLSLVMFAGGVGLFLASLTATKFTFQSRPFRFIRETSWLRRYDRTEFDSKSIGGVFVNHDYAESSGDRGDRPTSRYAVSVRGGGVWILLWSGGDECFAIGLGEVLAKFLATSLTFQRNGERWRPDTRPKESIVSTAEMMTLQFVKRAMNTGS